MKIALGLVATALAATPVHAGTINVQTLLSYCKALSGTQEYWFCQGFVGGVGDQMILNGIAINLPGGPRFPPYFRNIAACSGDPVTWGAMIQSFVNWAEKHPENWQAPGTLGVNTAVRETWPCQ